MRPLLYLGRQCARRGAAAPSVAHTIHAHIPRHTFRTFTSASKHLATLRTSLRSIPRRRGAKTLFVLALSPAAFIDLSEIDAEDGKTHEERMLEASRQELSEGRVPKRIAKTKFRRSIWLFVDYYIVEPIATAIRFLHLVVIFVPVIVTIPAIWFGNKLPDRDNERSGTIWWYGFLVSGMERAGAAFIKVRFERVRHT